MAAVTMCSDFGAQENMIFMEGVFIDPFSSLPPFPGWCLCVPRFTSDRNKAQSSRTEAQVYKAVNFSGDFPRQVAGSRRLRVYWHREVCRQALGFY